MRIILHIGTSKTGTTTIQHVLNENREHLKSFGYYYLHSMGDRSHVAFPRCFFPDVRPKDEYLRNRGISTQDEFEKHKNEKLLDFENEMKSMPPEIHTVVTSCEHFYSRLKAPAEIGALARYLRLHFEHVQIVVYLRNQPDLVTSLYSTALKSDGEVKQFTEFSEGICREQNTYFNYHLGLCRWRDEFGAQAISARLFDRKEFLDGDLLSDFFGKIDPVLLPGLRREQGYLNESINHIGQVLARSVNVSEPRYIEGVGSNGKNRRLISEIANAFRGKGEELPEYEYNRISAEFHKANESLRKEFFPSRDDLFSTERKTGPNSGRMLTPEQEKVLSSLVERPGSRQLQSHDTVRILRDSAIALEKVNLRQAYQLMKLAQALKPEGAFIQKKILAYEEKIAAQDAAP